jgi:hypothetical protein
MTSRIRQITIEGDLSQVADRFTVPCVGTEFFVTAERNKPIEITVGYKGQELHQLSGEIDLYELTYRENSILGRVSGRDLGARLIGRLFKKTYFRFPPNPEPTKPIIENGQVVGQIVLPYAVGAFTAAKIAGEIAGHVGLELQWDAPDYKIQDNVLAFSAPAGECLRRLVQTMGQPEMFAIDIYTVGTSLVVRQRKAAYPEADYSLALSDLMTTDIEPQTRAGPLYGTVTIVGGSPGGLEVDRPPDEQMPEEVEITEVNETPPVFPLKGKLRVTTTKRILQSVAQEVLLSERAVTEIEVNIGGSGTADQGPPPPISGNDADTNEFVNSKAFIDGPYYPSGWASTPGRLFRVSTLRAQELGLLGDDSAYVGMELTLTTSSGDVFHRRVAAYDGDLFLFQLEAPALPEDLYAGGGFTWRFDAPAGTAPQPGDEISQPPSAGTPVMVFIKTAETRKAITYDSDLLLDDQGRINIPLKLKETTENYGLGASVTDLRLIGRESTGYAYNDDMELILQDTLIEELTNSVEKEVPPGSGIKLTIGGELIPVERRVVRNQRLDANQYQVTTQIFQITTLRAGAVTRLRIDPVMRLVATDIKVTRGQLPGPQHIRRPRRRTGTGGGTTGGHVLREVTISSDPDAIDVQISDTNLTEALADQLVGQFSAASGLWRHEVSIDHLALPFLSKGKILGWKEALSGLPDALPNALIFSRRLDYDEGTESPSFRETLGLVWWGPQ